MNEIIQRLQARATAHEEFITDYDRSILSSNAYLDQGTDARAWWHQGYRVALLDVIRLLSAPASAATTEPQAAHPAEVK